MGKTRRDDRVQVEIEGMNERGEGIGRYRNQSVAIPLTIPGETVAARVVKTTGTMVLAHGVTLLEASADRVLPRCAHFGLHGCGLCQWQHVDGAVQALIKQDMLTELLEREGITNPPVRAIIAAPHAWGYNHHMTFTVADRATHAPVRADAPIPEPDVTAEQDPDAARDGDDDDAPLPVPPDDHYLGYPSLGDDNRILPIEVCHILHPDLLALYPQLDLDLTNIRRVRMQIGSDGAAMLVLTLLSDQAPLVTTDQRLSVNAILPDNEPINLIGESHSRIVVKGHEFRATAGSFFRANIAQIPALVDAVIELLDPQPHQTVLDLYAGVGVFSAFIAPRAALVMLVESYPPAVTDADHNLRDIGNIDVIEGGVDVVLEALDERCDAAVIDPPTRGVSDGAIQALAALGVKRIVYVASDVGQMARDAKKLRKAGYRLETIQPIDTNPQTVQLDAVALFTRAD